MWIILLGANVAHPQQHRRFARGDVPINASGKRCKPTRPATTGRPQTHEDPTAHHTRFPQNYPQSLCTKQTTATATNPTHLDRKKEPPPPDNIDLPQLGWASAARPATTGGETLLPHLFFISATAGFGLGGEDQIHSPPPPAPFRVLPGQQRLSPRHRIYTRCIRADQF